MRSTTAKPILLALLSVFVFFQGLAAEQIAPGLRYERRSESGPLSIHWLEVDPARISITLRHARDGALGRQTVSALALEEGALGAVNGGFFRMGGPLDGKPTGILKVGERWLSDSPLPRGVIGWQRTGADVLIGRLRVFWSLRIGKWRFPVDRINGSRGASSAILYTGAFDASTHTEPGGQEVIVSNDRVTKILSSGNAPIPKEGFVYSVGAARRGREQEKLSALRPRMRIRVDVRFQPGFQAQPAPRARWSGMDFILGGTPVLLSAGRKVSDVREERIQDSFVTRRHPRTAVGIRKDGTWILLVVDGRQEQISVGMTLDELADYLLSLGCVRALNLDGGGSSTLFVDGRTRNSPSDPLGERPVSDAILLFPKGAPKEVAAEGDGRWERR